MGIKSSGLRADSKETVNYVAKIQGSHSPWLNLQVLLYSFRCQNGHSKACTLNHTIKLHFLGFEPYSCSCFTC